MNEINFIFPAVKEIFFLSAGCACEIIVAGHGYVWGTKLTIIEPPTE